MKKFIIINGLNATVVERETLEDARNTAINICDHSKEIVIREINSIIQ
jgi:hypothetical protein